VYFLPAARIVTWGTVVAVLLASFQAQIFVDNDYPLCRLWADFSSSRRPHLDEIDAAVDAALAVAVWYITERLPPT
jgi:hypothetical protein